MPRVELIEQRLTHSVIGAFFEVYNTLGYGFLEHLYMRAMERELRARGHCVVREVAVRVMYKESELGIQRLDLIVDDKLVVEPRFFRIISPTKRNNPKHQPGSEASALKSSVSVARPRPSDPVTDR